MKKCFISLLLFLCIFTFGINLVKADDVKTWFILKDEQGNLITNGEFEIYSLYGNNTFAVTNESNENESLYTFLNTDEVTKEKGLSLLNDEQKTIINSINTYNDYVSKQDILEKGYSSNQEFIADIDNYKGLIGEIVTLDGQEPSGGDIPTNIDYISINAINYVVLEETKAPLGIVRNKYIIPIKVTFFMTMNETGDLTTEYIMYKMISNFINYKSSVDFKNLKEAIKYYVNNRDSINAEIKTGCDEDFNSLNGIPIPVAMVPNTGDGEGGLGSACSHNPVIVDKVGTYNVNVTSYVNGSEATNAIIHDTVRVKVKISNEGTVDSYNNVVMARIPDGVNYVEGSVTDSGVYNELEKTITWNIDRLDASSTKEFSYDVIIPNNATINGTFVANATLNSDNATEAIVSNDSTIRVTDIVNPKTGDIEKAFFILALCVGFSILYILHSKKNLLNL